MHASPSTTERSEPDDESMTKATATKTLTEELTAKAINDHREHREPTPWEERLADKDNPADIDILAAYLTGLDDGSTAVAHRWIESDLASAIRYWAGKAAIKKLAEHQDGAK
jgi:hypothetical protein